jgi:hypothetical protein
VAGQKICDDLIVVRVTATLPNTPPRYSPVRTIQLLAQARQNPGTCLICGGLTGFAAAGTPITGNVNIAGSIQIADKGHDVTQPGRQFGSDQ